MDIASILSDLRAERERISQVITALESLEGASSPVAKPKGGTSFDFGANKPVRRISAAGRARIAAAARARWAKLKRAAGKQSAPVKKAAPSRHMSAAARKRIAEAMKKRWAARKKAAAKKV